MLELYLTLLLIPTAAMTIWHHTLRLFDVRNWNAYRITGLIGTPVHEFSHMLACLIFGMPITKVKLFSPDPTTGQLGSVQFQYNPLSPLHVVGRLGQAIAPLLTGILLVSLTFDLKPMGQLAPTSGAFPIWIGSIVTSTLTQSFSMLSESIADAGTLMLVVCIAMHAIPSRADVFIGLRALLSLLIGVGIVLVLWEWLVQALTETTSWPAHLLDMANSTFMVVASHWVTNMYMLVSRLMVCCIITMTALLTLSFTANTFFVVLPSLVCRVIQQGK